MPRPRYNTECITYYILEFCRVTDPTTYQDCEKQLVAPEMVLYPGPVTGLSLIESDSPPTFHWHQVQYVPQNVVAKEYFSVSVRLIDKFDNTVHAQNSSAEVRSELISSAAGAKLAGGSKNVSHNGFARLSTLIIDGPSGFYTLSFYANVTDSTLKYVSKKFYVFAAVTHLTLAISESEYGDESFFTPPEVTLMAGTSLCLHSRLLVKSEFSTDVSVARDGLTWIGSKTALPRNGKAVFDSLGAKNPKFDGNPSVSLTVKATNAADPKSGKC